MTKFLLAALVMIASTSASAASYIVTIQGTVAQQYATPFTTPGATSPIKVGDVINATFSFDNSQAVGGGTNQYSLTGANDAVFTLGGFTWTSGGDFLAGASPPRVTLTNGVYGGYTGTMDDSPGGDLRVRGFAFDVAEFGYALYTGPGFKGMFDQNSAQVSTGGNSSLFAVNAVPDAKTWVQMIIGFLVVGIAIRRSRARRAGWMDVVGRLSGRVREAA